MESALKTAFDEESVGEFRVVAEHDHQPAHRRLPPRPRGRALPGAAPRRARGRRRGLGRDRWPRVRGCSPRRRARDRDRLRRAERRAPGDRRRLRVRRPPGRRGGAGARHQRGQRAPGRLPLPQARQGAARRWRYSWLSHADVDTLIKQFIAEHEAGGDADPRAFLERAERRRPPRARRADRRLPDARAPAAVGPRGLRALERAGAGRRLWPLSVEGSSGLWPSLLPRLRERARLKRSEVVSRAGGSARGASADRTKVERYYHEMESGGAAVGRGLGPGAGGAGPDRRAEQGGAATKPARSFGEPAAGAPAQAAFARTADVEAGPVGASRATRLRRSPPEQWDEVDRLFRGG